MKKLLIYLGIIVALFALLYYLNWASNQKANSEYTAPAKKLYQTTPDKLKPETRSQLKDVNYQNIIIPDDLEQKIKDGETLTVYFFSPLCSYCRETTPVLNEIAAEVGADYYQMNVYEFEDMWSKYRLDATPTLIHFENGQEIERKVGGISENNPGNTREDFKQFLTEYAVR